MPGLGPFAYKSSCVSSKVADSVSKVGEHSAISMNHVTSRCFAVPPLVAIYRNIQLTFHNLHGCACVAWDDPETASASGLHFSELFSYTHVLAFRHSKYSG
jgi:hypothetical protein